MRPHDACRRHRRGACGLAVLVLLAACSRAEQQAEQAATEAFQKSWTGTVSKTYPTDLRQGTQAVKAGLGKLHFRVTDESEGFKRRDLDAERDDLSASVEIVELAEKSTRVGVRVGWLGDEDASRRIHSEIESELKRREGPLPNGLVPPPVPVPPPPRQP